MVIYHPRHFPLQELVDPTAFKALGNRAWLCLDPRLVWTLDQIRELHGKTIVNDWHHGGQFQSRGFRSPDNPVGVPYSQHRFGRAADMHFVDKTVAEVREHILSNPNILEYRHITAVEKASWLHIDLRPHDKAAQGIFLFNP